MSTTPNGELEVHRDLCSAQAEEAERLATEATGPAREQYLNLAESWRQLIREIEQIMRQREKVRGDSAWDGWEPDSATQR